MAKFKSNSPDDTESLGRRVGSKLRSGDIILLSGDLGGGKTCFVRGLADGMLPGLGDRVASPTFAIMNEYSGDGLRICHFDFYRMRGEDDIISLGFEEYLNSDAVCVIEWPERLEELLPEQYLAIMFEYAGESYRWITLTARGDNYAGLIDNLVLGDAEHNE